MRSAHDQGGSGMLTIALAGNPNTGKTSLFNSLTGSYEYVGNWSGVTVEKKVGKLKQAQGGSLLDLPGIYSLNPLTADEEVASRCLLHEPIDAVLNVVDASQLRRNLLLTIQLLELGKPMLLALNMVDVAVKRGIHIHAEQLAERLGIPVVPVVARTGRGCADIGMLVSGEQRLKAASWKLDYGHAVEKAVAAIEQVIPTKLKEELQRSGRSTRWLALQSLEGNRVMHEYLAQHVDASLLARIYETVEQELRAEQIPSVHQQLLKVRSAYIEVLLQHCVLHDRAEHVPLTEKLDRIVTNKWLGIPIFLLLLYTAFMFTFDWLGSPLSDQLDAFFSGPLTNMLQTALTAAGASPFIHALVLDGVVGGVGGVLVFVPQIFILFLLISFIEDSGYMARVAVVMDRLAEGIGLSGKAFIPLVIGFGCNVPGVMSARTIEQPKERLLTILLTPLMSCSARLAVYSLFAGALFARHQALVVLSLYVLGIVVAMLLAKLFSAFMLSNQTSIFVIELPPYRVPQWKSLWRSTWEKGKGFIAKAGTFIFGGSVLIWLLSYVGTGGIAVPMDESLLAAVGGLIAPLFEPLGFGTWQAGAALITGFFAKEVVVSTMNIMYAAPDAGSLQAAVAHIFTPVQAFSFMAFLLLYVPCLATVAAIRKETMSARWTWFSVGYAFVIAYLISWIIHTVGTWVFG